MPNTKVRKPRPLHPFPVIAGCRQPSSDGLHAELHTLTRAELIVISHLKRGARILFDIEHKRALLYSFKRGVEHLAELTVRSLSSLLKAGKLIVAGREGRLVHYALAC